MGHIIFDVLFLLIGVGLILACAKRGFLRNIIHFCKTLLAFVAAYFFGSKLGEFLCNNFILSPVRDFVYDKIHGAYVSASESFDANAILAALPEFMKTEEVQQKILSAEGSGEQLVNNAADSIATPVATVISNILGYVGVFVIALVVLWIGAIILDKLIDHIVILDRVNTLLGALLGLLIAMVVLFVLSSALKFFFAGDPLYTDSVIVKFFGDSSLPEKIKILDVGASWFSK